MVNCKPAIEEVNALMLAVSVSCTSDVACDDSSVNGRDKDIKEVSNVVVQLYSEKLRIRVCTGLA
jgi:hypothetical protein